MSDRNAPPLVAISMGDPAGIGPEIILKAAAELAAPRDAPALAVIGDLRAMRAAAKRIGGVPEPRTLSTGGAIGDAKGVLAVIEASELAARSIRPARPTIEGADAAFRYIVAGARMVMAGEAAALVTAPINKEWLNRAGHHFPGHSELLAKLSGTRLWRMMFTGGELKLALVTVHIGLARVARRLTDDLVFQTIGLMAAHLREVADIRRPRIAVLGFNPHAGEGGLFGDEEGRAITPAIERARRARIDAYGPLAPDTAFIRRGGHFGFDAAIAMYHDQGLIALKTLEFYRAVNVTLGLPFVRTSPDHGTAYELAGTGEASADSMRAAIEYAWRAARARRARSGRAA